MKHRKTILALVALLGSPPAAMAAGPGASNGAPERQKDVWELYALANQGADSFPFHVQLRPLGDPSPDAMDGQLKATLDAELGLYDEAIATFPTPVNEPIDPSPLPQADAAVADAADAILRLARDRRILIINEAHHVAQTRALFLDLLPRLRAAGFTDYCAETLDIADAPAIQERGYPLRTDGLYSREPVFGEEVRTAARLGYRLCGYDNSGKSQQDRETGQARILAELLRDPKVRLLVHAGYNHARKGPMPSYSPMAMELQRMTGVEPLTVDQTALRPDIPVSRESDSYRALAPRIEGAKRGGVFVAADGKPWSQQPRSYDISVILPQLPQAHGRPGWLWELPGRRPVPDFDADCMGRYPCAIEARHAEESEDAVPADIVVHENAGEAVPALALPDGRYRLRTVGPDGATLRESVLTVPPEE
jgi:hypothetical protein